MSSVIDKIANDTMTTKRDGLIFPSVAIITHFMSYNGRYGI